MTTETYVQAPSADASGAYRPTFAEHSVMRWSLDYMLRLLHETSVAFDGDLISGIIFLALIRANTQHLSEATQRQYSQEHGIILDEARRPATVKSISDSLNLPYETVRRHLGKLAAAGRCERAPGRGYLATESILRRPEYGALMSRGLGHFHQMLDRLHRADLDPRGLGGRV